MTKDKEKLVVLLVDEPHHWAAKDWPKLLQTCGVRVLAVRATPLRADSAN
jgi:hypothetical protein